MDTRLLILQKLDEICRARDLDDTGDIQWEDGQLLRLCTISAQRGDLSSWQKFISHLRTRRLVATGFVQVLADLGWVEYSTEEDEMVLTLPNEFSPLAKLDGKDLHAILNPDFESENKSPSSRDEKLGAVMYIEEKPGLTGHGLGVSPSLPLARRFTTRDAACKRSKVRATKLIILTSILG